MALVSINIDAMIEYVAALESAIADSRWAAAALQSLCTQAGEWDADCASFNGGESTAQLEALLADAKKRLGLAQLIAAMTPSLEADVVMDDRFVDSLPADFVFHEPDPELIETVKAKLLDAGSDREFSDEDAQQAAIMIATMVANSPEPYKSLFTEHIGDVTFVDVKTEEDKLRPGYDLPSGAHFNFFTNTIHIDIDQMLTDVPAPYHTFFHEFGHAIDDFEGGFGSETSTYRHTTAEESKMSLPDLLNSDVYNDIQTRLINNGYASDSAQAERVAEAVVNWSTFYLAGWELGDFGYQTDTAISGTDAEVFVQLRTFYERGDKEGRVFNSDVTRTASDIYGAVTNHGIDGRYGHHDWHYWLAPGISGAPEKEFWAGFYADNITNYWELAEAAAPGLNPTKTPDSSILGQTGLDVTLAMLPSASQAAAAMAEQMAKP